MNAPNVSICSISDRFYCGRWHPFRHSDDLLAVQDVKLPLKQSTYSPNI